ncbi:MAG: pyruvate dehydrogenase complex dihydrolipoamide acetyltransferase [Bacteroidia bacterium]
MAEIVKMPKLSDTMTEGVVAKWHKKVGDKVKNGEILADIETDKATMEFESFYDGVLLYIGAEEKKAAPIDSLLAIIGKEGEDISSIVSSFKSEVKSSEPATVSKQDTSNTKQETTKQETAVQTPKPEIPSTVNIVRMPKLSDTMTEGVVAKWHKKVGDKVKSGEILADIETDKATMEFESFFDGVLLYTGAEAGKPAAIDSLLAIIGKGGEDVSAIVASFKSEVKSEKTEVVNKQKATVEVVKEAAPQLQTSNSKLQTNKSNGRIKASPLAKAFAKEKGIDLSSIQGSGDFGRIIKKDIEFFGSSGGGKKSTFVGTESFTDEPVSQMRKVIAKRLVESVVNAPHFYLTMEIDMDHCIASREAINKVQDVKVSYNDIVIKACAAAIRKHPKVNGAWMGDKIRYNHHIHIGMAVAVEDGLLVPVIRFADGKSLQEISTEAKDFGKRAKEKKLQPKDWEGNTFTVSNLGMFGIDQFTSIINTPEACILAVGGINQVPVVKNGAIVPGNIMKITLSCDHRVVDGATGAAFLQTLKIYLENPVTMFV